MSTLGIFSPMSTFYIGKNALTDSLQACVRVDIKAYEIVLVFGIDSLHACVPVDIKVYEIVPIGLALIVKELLSVLTN